MLASALLLLSLLSAGDHSAPSPLAGCHATPLGEGGWLYQCGEVSAQRADLAGPHDGEARAAGMQAGYAALLGEGAEKDRTVLRVGGAEVSALRARAAKGGGVGWVVTLPRSEGTRILGCLSMRAGDRCARMLDHLAGEPWRAGVAVGAVREATAPLKLNGKAVPVPRGCEVISTPRASGVRCPSGDQATWIVVADEAEGRRLMEQYANLTGTNLRRAGVAFTQGAVGCRLAGIDTTCARVAYDVNQAPQVMLWAMARVGAQLLVGYCMGPGGTPLPEPCSFAFAF